jgi:hypothetical protein
MLQGVLSDEAMEVRCQRARDFRWSPRARAIDQAWDPLAGKTMDPLAKRGIGKGEGVRDGVQTLSFHDVAHGLGTAEDAGVFGLLYEGVSGRERVIGKVECEGAHMRVSSNKLLQKYEHPPSHDVVTLLSAQNLSDSNFPEAASYTRPLRYRRVAETDEGPLSATHTCSTEKELAWHTILNAESFS